MKNLKWQNLTKKRNTKFHWIKIKLQNLTEKNKIKLILILNKKLHFNKTK